MGGVCEHNHFLFFFFFFFVIVDGGFHIRRFLLFLLPFSWRFHVRFGQCSILPPAGVVVWQGLRVLLMLLHDSNVHTTRCIAFSD